MTGLSVVGGGAWGTALAAALARARDGATVPLWAREAEVVEAVNRDSVNARFLPGVELPRNVRATSSLREAGAETMLLAVPAQHLREVTGLLAPHVPEGACAVVCAKGIEQDTCYLMSEVLAETMPGVPCAVLSGPSFADEVARGLPAAVTLAAPPGRHGESVVALLARTTIRPYPTTDVIGAQVGGAVKNVLAIACGIAEGAGYGKNVRAALIARGIVEIRRLGIACGGRAETLDGLAGVGDIVLTCTSADSRNYALGREVGGGAEPGKVLSGRHTVAEGVPSSLAVRQLARTLSVEMPITEAVTSVLHEGADIRAVAEELLRRPIRAEEGGE